MIRPWIKECFDNMALSLKLKLAPCDEAFFLLNDYDDIIDGISPQDAIDLVFNKHSREFFETYIARHKSLEWLIPVDELLHHEYATSLLRPMLDTIVVFEKYATDDWSDKIIKWIDEDLLHLITLGMEREEANTVMAGVPYLRSLCNEMELPINTSLSTIIDLIGSRISDKESSVDYLIQNSIFINTDALCLNPRWEDVLDCDFSVDAICKNHGAFDLLKSLNPAKLNWAYIAQYHRSVHLVESNIERIKTNSLWSFVLMNEYLMPVVEHNIDTIDPRLLCYINENSSAIEYLKNNQHLVNEAILCNSNIVTYNYAKIRIDRHLINESIMQNLFSPSRIQSWIDGGNLLEDYLP